MFLRTFEDSVQPPVAAHPCERAFNHPTGGASGSLGWAGRTEGGAELSRELAVLELLLEQLRQLNAENAAAIETKGTDEDTPGAVLARLKGIGPQIASVLWFEGLYRKFSNRREVAAYAGLAPTPWRSGSIDREQGISKAGNRRLRHIMIELAWLWVRHQPDSTLTRWFQERVGTERGRVRRVAIVALARKLLIALWRYVTHGEIPEGAALKPS
jgi:transposase